MAGGADRDGERGLERVLAGTTRRGEQLAGAGVSVGEFKQGQKQGGGCQKDFVVSGLKLEL